MTERAEKPQEAQSALPPLPVLPVLRAENCDQAMTDANVAYLEKNRPDLLQRLWREEGVQRSHDYFETAWDMLDELNAEGPGIPPDHLGRLDLALEISRRLRAAHRMGATEATGKPLAAKAGDPLPPLAVLEIDEGTKRRGGLSQEQVDRILAETYATRPDLWYAYSEEYRNDLFMTAAGEFIGLLNDIVTRDFSKDEQPWKAGELRFEAQRRLQKMCGFGA